MAYDWSWRVVVDNFGVLLHGFARTIEVTFASALLGVVCGAVVGTARLARNRVVAFLAATYVEVMLAIPVLVLLIWLYFCLPLFLPALRITSWAAAVVALVSSLAAFVGEIVASGISSVPRAQTEVALALGFTRWETLRRIVLPQAFRSMIAPIVGQVITCWKLSTLASVIAVYEVLHTAEAVISQTFRPLELYTAVAALFIVTVMPANMLVRRLYPRLAETGYR